MNLPVACHGVCTPVRACHSQGGSPCRSLPQLRSRRYLQTERVGAVAETAAGEVMESKGGRVAPDTPSNEWHD
jgi:hypothetical protein